MSKELQKDDITLPGGLGTVKRGDAIGAISSIWKGKDGATTVTVTHIMDEMKPLKDYLTGKSSTTEFIEECKQITNTENADFEIVDPKQIEDKP